MEAHFNRKIHTICFNIFFFLLFFDVILISLQNPLHNTREKKKRNFGYILCDYFTVEFNLKKKKQTNVV